VEVSHDRRMPSFRPSNYRSNADLAEAAMLGE
jgi:hypothetical protein